MGRGQKNRILIIDDDETLLRLARLTLEKRAFEVDTAATGAAGLSRAKAAKPDLILLDIVLPDVDGWSVIKRLRSTQELLFVPVIFISILSDPESRVKGFSLGADDYLAKPFRLEELAFRVARSLRRCSEIEPAVTAQVEAEVEATATPAAPTLRGTIGEIGSPSILLLLERAKRSGRLTVTRTGRNERSETVEILVRDGRVLRARYVLGSEPQPQDTGDALFRLLDWPQGYFEFTPCLVDIEDEVQTTTSRLLWEIVRRLEGEDS